MSTALAFDVGKTVCRAVLFTDGIRAASGRCDGARGLADPGGPDGAAAAMIAAAEAAGSGCADVIGAGLAGFSAAGAQARQRVAALLAPHAREQVVVASDVVTAHAGAFGGRPGIVVVAGTGSVALGIAEDGRSASADGHGYLLGDAGSGVAIGRAGLVNALREHDGRGGSAALAQRASDRFGALSGLPGVVHAAPNPASVIASFAADVIAAAHAGDHDAVAICAQAGHDLAELAVAVRARLALPGPCDVALLGGIAEAGEPITVPFASSIAAAPLRLHAPEGDACDGALAITTDPSLPHEQLVSRKTLEVG